VKNNAEIIGEAATHIMSVLLALRAEIFQRTLWYEDFNDSNRNGDWHCRQRAALDAIQDELDCWSPQTFCPII